MAYNDQEISIQGGAPYFLYEFVTPDATFRYTDYPDVITYDSNDYDDFPIRHSEIKQTSELSKNGVTVTIPIQGTFAALFLGWSPDYIVSCTIRRGHFGATDTLVYWKGRVVSHNIHLSTIELKCESIFTSMRRAGIRARYQRNCRHALYGAGCGVSKASYAVAGTVSAVDELELTITAADSYDDGYFLGGIVEMDDGSFRLIKSHEADAIVMNRSSRYITDGGTTVTLYPGCDRTIAMCKDRFNNLVNNGGFKWIPSKNPMGGSSIL